MLLQYVLIVEDKPDMLESLVASLRAECKSKGLYVNILTAQRLSSARKIMRENPIDLISTDLQYPIGVDPKIDVSAGFRFIQELRERLKCDKPIFLLTSMQGEELKKHQEFWAVRDDQFVLVHKDYLDQWRNEMLKALISPK
jgi:CheY-like chemotaxis protein